MAMAGEAPNEPLILASASPARARLLAAAGLEFRVEPAAVDEDAVKRRFRADRRAADECALALATAKARRVAQRVAQRCQKALVIGADQILDCGGDWFDKPAGRDNAETQLRALRGRTHRLVTAVCVVRGEQTQWHTVALAELTMRRFSDRFLDAYLAAEGAAVLGTVGAYRVEGIGIQLFDRIAGDYFAILGLPLVELLGFLREHGRLTG